ncbi:hypothetical protein ACWEN6_13775 [Sphaerisporangium sp. NPDC004334]
MSSNDNHMSGPVGCLILIVILLFVGGVSAYKTTTGRTEQFTVQRTERVCDGGKHGSCRYLVWTDRGVYENTDELFRLKRNSSDIQGMLLPGHTYKADVQGWRNGFTSSYPNIISVVDMGGSR